MSFGLVPQQRAGRPRAGRWWQLIAVAVAGALLAAGCGDDDEAARDEQQATSTTSTSTSTTSTTQPPGTDPAAVEPIVNGLLDRLDVITDEIIKDPTVVLDPDTPILAEFAEVHAPGEAYDARLRTYRENAERGLTVEALNGERTSTTTMVGPLSTVDPNTVEGSLCTVYNYRATDAQGYGEVKDGLAHPGRVTAIRLDGTWKIQQIDEDDAQVCNPETAT